MSDTALTPEEEVLLPAWSLRRDATDAIGIVQRLPESVDREWAFGGATGRGVRVCILDSGIERNHPLVGRIDGAVSISLADDGQVVVEEETEQDVCGHGTACAGVVRSLAPDTEIYSVRVLGPASRGRGSVLLAGLQWAVAQGYDVVNMSLSTTKKEFGRLLQDAADNAYFRRTVIVAAAHNMPVESFPWRFSSVVSVGSHEEADPLLYNANPSPPVEFFARGVNVDVAWPGGATIRATGNSFATPCISGVVALILSKHPGLTPFEVKTVLHLTASNVGGPRR